MRIMGRGMAPRTVRNGATLAVLTMFAAGGLGCAHKFPPPRELVEARAAYSRASAGPAQQLAPARLKLARQALQAAEMSYGGAPESEVRDRAYIAIRRAEAAEAEAEGDLAAQRRERALHELASLSGVHAERARAELAAAGQQVDQANQQALSERQRADEEQRRANEANASLQGERQARTQAEAQARQAMAELERLANVKREARGVVITLSGQVLFVTDQATLLPAARTSLDSVAAALKTIKPETGRVGIEGHTDSTGPRGYNLELSQKRAQSVRDYLVSQGVPGNLLTTQGVGPDRPVANNRSPEGRANNRRVEIIIPTAAALAQGGDAGGSAAGGATAAPTTPSPSSVTPPPPTLNTPPSPGTTVPPASPGVTTPPASPGTTTPPPATVTTPPSPGTSTPPASSTTPPPSPGATTPPASSTTPPPSPGTRTPPASSTTPPPSPGTRTPPASSTTSPPSPGTSTPPPSPGTTSTPR